MSLVRSIRQAFRGMSVIATFAQGRVICAFHRHVWASICLFQGPVPVVSVVSFGAPQHGVVPFTSHCFMSHCPKGGFFSSTVDHETGFFHRWELSQRLGDYPAAFHGVQLSISIFCGCVHHYAIQSEEFNLLGIRHVDSN